MQAQNLAHQSILEIERKGPQLGELWRESWAQRGYALAGGDRNTQLQRAVAPLLKDATARAAWMLNDCSLAPRPLPVQCMSTCSPNGLSVYHHRDQSYAVGIDQAFVVWQFSVIGLLCEAVHQRKPDAWILKRMLPSFDIMIAQRFPDRIEHRWGFIFSMLINQYRNSRAGARWRKVTIPLTFAWTQFILAHEIAHIELDHLRSTPSGLQGKYFDKEVNVTAFLGDQDEYDADNWALEKLRSTEESRPFDQLEERLTYHWQARPSSVIAARIPIIETSISLCFMVWAMVEPLIPTTVKGSSHPPSASRVSALGLDHPLPEVPGAPYTWKLLEAVRERLNKIVASGDWYSAIHKNLG